MPESENARRGERRRQHHIGVHGFAAGMKFGEERGCPVARREIEQRSADDITVGPKIVGLRDCQQNAALPQNGDADQGKTDRYTDDEERRRFGRVARQAILQRRKKQQRPGNTFDDAKRVVGAHIIRELIDVRTRQRDGADQRA